MPARAKPSRSPPPKLQRWVDLLAALLSHRTPITFATLRAEVPGYATGASDAACERMFERDKDELRSFGAAIETVKGKGEDEKDAYRLRREEFYLPFLAVSASGAAATRSVPPEGYRSLSQLAFEPDELDAIGDAAARIRVLGDPMLAADAESALRKLAFDLPLSTAPPGDERVMASRVDAKMFATLGAALFMRKIVEFTYHAMQNDKTTQRSVESYGLVFLGSHWYLVARDRGRGEMRTFRLSRMSSVSANKKSANKPDYEIPASFHLEQASRSRDTWNLGDGEETDVTVQFSGDTGTVRAAAKLGAPVSGRAGARRFRVRRPDHFARWLLSFGGSAMPVEPAEFVKRFKLLARETLAVVESKA